MAETLLLSMSKVLTLQFALFAGTSRRPCSSTAGLPLPTLRPWLRLGRCGCDRAGASQAPNGCPRQARQSRSPRVPPALASSRATCPPHPAGRRTAGARRLRVSLLPADIVPEVISKSVRALLRISASVLLSNVIASRNRTSDREHVVFLVAICQARVARTDVEIVRVLTTLTRAVPAGSPQQPIRSRLVDDGPAISPPGGPPPLERGAPPGLLRRGSEGPPGPDWQRDQWRRGGPPGQDWQRGGYEDEEALSPRRNNRDTRPSQVTNAPVALCQVYKEAEGLALVQNTLLSGTLHADNDSFDAVVRTS
jgi:hypothetical protein